MKKLKTIFKLVGILTIFFGMSHLALAATIVDESFEADCTDLSNSFSEGCISGWIAVSGTPDTESLGIPGQFLFELNPVTVPDGDRYARFYASKRSCSGIVKKISESFAVYRQFKKCANYQVSFQMMRITEDLANEFDGEYKSKVSFVLADGFNNVPPPAICNYGIPAITNDMQTVKTINYSPNDPLQWETFTFSFTPDEDFSQFVIIPEFMENFTGGVYHFLDKIVITEDNVPELPDFYFTTENSTIPQTEICYGEDVWVCLGDANFNWVGTQFNAYKEPAGSFYTKTGTVYGVDKNGCYNLSQMIRDRGNVLFKADQEYKVQMSIKHPECGWIHIYENFKMICCEEALDASFKYDITTLNNVASLSLTANTNYEELNGSHQFTVEVDINNDGVINNEDEWYTYNSNSFTYGVLNPDYTYYVNHCVETPCGTTCEKQKIEFCRDCEQDCEVSGLSCWQNSNDTYISWASTNAQSYSLLVFVNDPSCGCLGTPQFVFKPNLTNTFFRQDPAFGCFSYRVRPNCLADPKDEDSLEPGDWSEKVCSDCIDLKSLQDDDDDPAKDRGQVREHTATSFSVHPNPFTDLIQLEIEGFSATNTTIEIYTLTGQLLLQKKLLEERIIDLGHLSYAGILLVKVSDGEQMRQQKIIKL